METPFCLLALFHCFDYLLIGQRCLHTADLVKGP